MRRTFFSFLLEFPPVSQKEISLRHKEIGLTILVFLYLLTRVFGQKKHRLIYSTSGVWHRIFSPSDWPKTVKEISGESLIGVFLDDSLWAVQFRKQPEKDRIHVLIFKALGGSGKRQDFDQCYKLVGALVGPLQRYEEVQAVKVGVTLLLQFLHNPSIASIKIAVSKSEKCPLPKGLCGKNLGHGHA